MNLCIFTGNLTADPKVKAFNNDRGPNNKVEFRIGVNDHSPRKETCFCSCEAWGKTADMIAKHFRKGDLITVFTRRKVDVVPNKDGEGTREFEKFVLERFEFPETRKPRENDEGDTEAPEEADSSPAPPAEKPAGKAAGKGRGGKSPEPATAGVGDDDGIPF